MFLKNFNVKNKTALVTGSGKGIGKACAIALAEAGSNVIILSRTEKDLLIVQNKIKKLKKKCSYYVCDVTNLKEIKNISFQSWLLILHSGIFVSIAAHMSMFYLYRMYPVNRVFPFYALFPVFGVLLTFMIFYEIPTLITFIGGVIVIVATYFINKEN